VESLGREGMRASDAGAKDESQHAFWDNLPLKSRSLIAESPTARITSRLQEGHVRVVTVGCDRIGAATGSV